MRVYHGSNVCVSEPDTSHSRNNVDFGRGFYVTTILDQAKKWASKFDDKGVISVFEYNENTDGLKVKTFGSYSEEWLDFVFECRKGADDSDYDIVIGGVANDRVFDTIQLCLEGIIDKEQALGRLKYEEPNMQIAFRTDKAIGQCLRFTGCEQR